MSPTAERQHAHELIDRIQPGHLTTIVNLLEVMVDPVTSAMTNAPADDEPAGLRIASTSRAECTSHEEFLAELGFTQQDIDAAEEPSPAA